MREALAPWLYLAPALGAVVAFTYAPLGYAGWLSLHQWNMMPTVQPRYVGLENFANLLTLPELGQALGNTFLHLAALLPLTVVIPVAIAILTQELRGPWRNLYRALIFVPLIIAPIVAAAVWRWLLDPRFGMVNAGFKALNSGASSYGTLDERIYSELTTDHPIDLCRYQVVNCYMGRAGLINSGGASGKHDLEDAVMTAVINKRAGGTGLISGRKAFQRPMADGAKLLNAIQDVYLAKEVTIA
jgi:hypothetical protein